MIEQKTKLSTVALVVGIEFLEKGEDALKREFKEEIDTDINVKKFLGVSENIFTYQGKNAHELILFYEIDVKNYKEKYIIHDDCGEYDATWIDIKDFKEKKKILYPEQIFQYI